MQTTANLGLKKPEGTDVVNIQDFNDNADLLDTAVAAKETPAAAQAKASTAELNAKAYTDTKVAGLVNSSPATLDTLKELADALGSDPNYAATTATLIGTKAPLASPVLTGTPTAPTAAVDTSTTQVATTAFVLGQAGTTDPVMNGTAGVGTSKRYARADHVHPVDMNRAAQTDFAAHLADYVRQPGYAVATGAANTYAVTLNPAPTGYVDGMGIAIKISAANTGVSTLNVNTLGARALNDPSGSSFTSGSLLINKIYSFKYDTVSGTFIQQGRGGDPNLVTGNIKSGVSIYGVAGKASVVDTSDANAIASQILAGLYAYVNGAKLTGTMIARSTNVAPNTIASWYPGQAGNTYAKAHMQPQQGYYDGSVWVSVDVPDMISANILSGKSIFGVAGTYVGAVTAGTVPLYTDPNSYTWWYNYYAKNSARYTMNYGGSIRIAFTMQPASSTDYQINSQIYKNGLPIGAERYYTPSSSSDTRTFEEDFTCNPGDYFEVWSHSVSSTGVRGCTTKNLIIKATDSGAISVS